MGDKKRFGRTKKRKFCGVVLKKKKNQDGGAHDPDVDNPELNTSASFRKLRGKNDNENEPAPIENVTEGFILIDVMILCDFLSKQMTCTVAECAGPVQCYMKVDNSQGFAHDIVTFCDSCECEHLLMTTSKRCESTDIMQGKKTPLEVNTRMVAFTRAIGKVHEKKRRKFIRAHRKGFQDKKEQEEGNVYEAGGH